MTDNRALNALLDVTVPLFMVLALPFVMAWDWAQFMTGRGK